MKRLFLAATIVLAASAYTACSEKHPSQPDEIETKPPQETPNLPPAPAGTVVSDPLTQNPVINAVAVSSTVVYVSAAPGSFVDISSASIRNETKQIPPVSVVVENGGFDPVGIEAGVGDRLNLTLSAPNGAASTYVIVVPPRKSPGVVRTSPNKGRVDVALNVQVEVIFSEPVDKATVSPSTIILRNGTTAVSGDVTLSQDGLTATFAPKADLEPATDYTLVVTSGVRDLDGDPLADELTSTFSTADLAVGTGPLIGKIVYSLAGDIYSANADGSGVVNLTGYAWWSNWSPSWSPDGTEIAFVSARNGVPPCPMCAPSGSGIYVMKADGSKVVRVSKEGWGKPVWSPDGRQIAYIGLNSIGIIDVNVGDPSVRYIHLDSRIYPTNLRWSPDGRTFAFGAWDPGNYPSYMPWSSIYTINTDGSGLRRLLPGGMSIHQMNVQVASFESFAWSPNGKRISVSVCRIEQAGYLENCDEFLTATGNYDGTSVSNLRLVAQTKYTTSEWDPDSQRIAFETNQGISYVTRDGLQSGVIVARGGEPSWHR